MRSLTLLLIAFAGPALAANCIDSRALTNCFKQGVFSQTCGYDLDPCHCSKATATIDCYSTYCPDLTPPGATAALSVCMSFEAKMTSHTHTFASSTAVEVVTSSSSVPPASTSTSRSSLVIESTTQSQSSTFLTTSAPAKPTTTRAPPANTTTYTATPPKSTVVPGAGVALIPVGLSGLVGGILGLAIYL